MNTLLNWKAKYGSIYQLELEGYLITYRALTAFETQAIRDLENKVKEDLELSICLLAVLEPSPFPEFKLPGTLSFLSNKIMESSLASPDVLIDKVEEARAWANDSLNTNYSITLAALICNFMPSVDIVSLLNMSLPQLLKVGALVENITKINFISGNPEEQKAGQTFSQKEKDQSALVLKEALQHLKNTK